MSEIIVRPPDTIYQIHGEIENGTFHGRWHFSFDEYNDQNYMHFGTLTGYSMTTLSFPGAVWPLHRHQEIEVVTYCAEGEFRHADEKGKGGILRKGWVQQLFSVFLKALLIPKLVRLSSKSLQEKTPIPTRHSLGQV